MKRLKKSGIYKAANVSYDPSKIEAYSYVWWRFVGKVGKLVIFNDFAYSVTTRKHQSKVQHLMRELGHTIDYVIECPAGLQNAHWAESSITLYAEQMIKLELEMKKPGTRKAKNAERAEQVAANHAFILLCANLGKVSKKHVKEIVDKTRGSLEFFAKRAEEQKAKPGLTLVVSNEEKAGAA